MIALSLLLGHALGAQCLTLSGASTRYNPSKSTCYEISDCCFINCCTGDLTDRSGGAIKLSSKKDGTATIKRCTFQACYATSPNPFASMGGAVFVELDTGTLTMGECCAKDCWCENDGQFLYIREEMTSTISQVTVLDSPAGDDNEKQGTIHFNTGSATADRMNLTDNSAKFGCAIYSSISQTSTKCSFLTVNRNTGNSVIYPSGKVSATIVYSHSNFVNNSAMATFILPEHIIEVRYCVFRGNRKDFSRPSDCSGTADIHHCIFDYDLASTPYLSISNNVNKARKTTLKIYQLNTRFCQAPIPCDFASPATK